MIIMLVIKIQIFHYSMKLQKRRNTTISGVMNISRSLLQMSEIRKRLMLTTDKHKRTEVFKEDDDVIVFFK